MFNTAFYCPVVPIANVYILHMIFSNGANSFAIDVEPMNTHETNIIEWIRRYIAV